METIDTNTKTYFDVDNDDGSDSEQSSFEINFAPFESQLNFSEIGALNTEDF